MTSNEWIAQRLKELCQERGISFNKLANMASITQSTLNSILQGESKNPKISTLAKLSNALGLSLSDFLKGLESDTDVLSSK